MAEHDLGDLAAIPLRGLMCPSLVEFHRAAQARDWAGLIDTPHAAECAWCQATYAAAVRAAAAGPDHRRWLCGWLRRRDWGPAAAAGLRRLAPADVAGLHDALARPVPFVVVPGSRPAPRRPRLTERDVTRLRQIAASVPHGE